MHRRGNDYISQCVCVCMSVCVCVGDHYIYYLVHGLQVGRMSSLLWFVVE